MFGETTWIPDRANNYLPPTEDGQTGYFQLTLCFCESEIFHSNR
jgi:hypothetical protein